MRDPISLPNEVWLLRSLIVPAFRTSPLRTGSSRSGFRQLVGVLGVSFALCNGVQLSAQSDDEPLKVTGLHFEGNEFLSDFMLRSSIATSDSRPLFPFLLLELLPFDVDRFFDELEFRRDVLRLIVLYRQTGFLAVALDTTVLRDERTVEITFHIREGDPVRVGRVDVTGTEGILPERVLTRDLPLRTGDTFDRLKLQISADSIRQALQDIGYPEAEVFRNFDVDTGSLTADVHFQVVPGPLATIDEISVVGSDRVSAAVVRRALTFQRGDVFRRRQLFQSQRSLYGLSAYNFVDVSLDPQSVGDNDSLVGIRVQVTEGRLSRLRGGVGYGTVDCFRTQASYRVTNFLGGARVLELAGRLSKIGALNPDFRGPILCASLREEPDSRAQLNHQISATLRVPFFLSRRNSAALTLFQERRSEFQAFVRQVVGLNLSFTRSLSERVPVTFSYDLSYGRTEADPATFCTFLNVCRVVDIEPFTSKLIRSTVGLSLDYNATNSPTNPTRGVRWHGEGKWASPTIGSDSLIQFARLLGEVTLYTRLGRGAVLAFRARSGRIMSSRLGGEGFEIEFIPPEERFYAGGPNSVRGFSQNELGPVVRVLREDSSQLISPTGGNAIVVGNAELRLPTAAFEGKLGFGLFLDVGQVFDTRADLGNRPGLRLTPGVGIRYATPIGPLRFDVAYNPYDPERSPLYKVDTDLVLQPDAPPPPAPSGFLQRLQLNFAIGEAF